MKTKQEIKDEILELYGASRALSEAMDVLHAQRMEKIKQMMALSHMLKEMDDDAEENTWVGLTKDEQSFVYSSLHNATSREDSFWVDFANAIEKALKEKNHG